VRNVLSPNVPHQRLAAVRVTHNHCAQAYDDGGVRALYGDPDPCMRLLGGALSTSSRSCSSIGIPLPQQDSEPDDECFDQKWKIFRQFNIELTIQPTGGR
jgi:hypothetical protein